MCSRSVTGSPRYAAAPWERKVEKMRSIGSPSLTRSSIADWAMVRRSGPPSVQEDDRKRSDADHGGGGREPHGRLHLEWSELPRVERLLDPEKTQRAVREHRDS